jgi:hypothetical protein
VQQSWSVSERHKAHRAATTHTGDRPSHTNNTDTPSSVENDSGLEGADVLDSTGKPREQAKRDEIEV